MNKRLFDRFKAYDDRAIDNYDTMFNHLMNLAINRFSWENLPEGLTSEHLERMLIERGTLIGYKSDYGLMILPCFGENNINVYGLPTTYRTFSANGLLNDLVKADEGILLKNNPTGTSEIELIEDYSKKITDIDKTQDVNLFQQNIPKIVIAEDGTELTVKNLVKKLKEFKFVIFARKSLKSSLGKNEVLDTSAPYLLDNLQDYRNDKYNEVLSLLSINNANTDKKERLLVDEVNANNDLIKINLDLMLDMREKFCEEFNAKFGTNLKVKEREVEISGEIHSNDNGTPGE